MTLTLNENNNIGTIDTLNTLNTNNTLNTIEIDESTKTGGKFRRKNFTMVSNNAIKDKTLTNKAKGLYSIIQLYSTYKNFDIYKGFLQSQSADGITAFESQWKELKDKGYLKQYRIIDKSNKGKISYEYDLLEVADLSTPALQTQRWYYNYS